MQNMDFWFFWNIFKKRWKIIIVVAFMAAILTGVYSNLFIPPVYQSSVALYFGRVTENPMERLVANATGNSALGATASELALGSQLSGDYSGLINSDVIREGVSEELAKLGRWQNHSYSASAELVDGSRIMRINIKGDHPVFCQEVANIYARQFISKIQQLVGIQNAQIIEEPGLQYRPVSPNVRKNIVLGFAGGFAGCFMLFFLQRMLDRTIRTSAEVESSLKIPVVGTVHKDKQFTLDRNSPLIFSGDQDPAEHRSQIAEDFRVFRVNLMNQKPEGEKKDGSVIAVTSAHAKEGKTFCTANLGAALAEAGYKVLLIDCDTGKRGLQSYLGKTDDKGLMNILSSDAKFEDVVKKNLNNLNMDVLFCGNPHVNSANLMVSPKFKDLMEKLKKQYDYAFLDVSCHLGTADIVSAGSTADSVLLLVRAGKTDSEMVQQTMDAMRRANLSISGVILNGVEDNA